METIKVNMNPNPLDVQTIHASQNDGEARQWGFELHNNGDAIDSSEITDQMVFKAYKGGTEQILPENGSTPTTSPFIGNIKYPQGLLSDQEFTYRQSPSEEDGIAKFTSIKGNTLAWNQLVPSLSTMSAQNGTLSVANNVATVTSSSSTNYLGLSTSGSAIISPKSEHKYLLTIEINSSKAITNCQLSYGNSIIARGYNISANTWTKVSSIVSNSSPTGQYVQCRGFGSFEQGDTMQVRNWNYFDLTAMGLDSINSIEEFTSLFPLPYYDYNTGTLLSFNGNGIKAAGFNQWDEEWEVGGLSVNGETVPGENRIRSKNFCPCIGGKTYYGTCGKIDGGNQNVYYLATLFYDSAQNFISSIYMNNSTFTAPSNAAYFKIATNSSTVIYGNEYNDDICINISSSKNGTYEPYNSSTLSLPISTYFPTGMKSAGSVYDELTPTKAITRIGAVDLGSLGYNYAVSSGVNYYFSLTPAVPVQAVGGMSNIKCPLYTPKIVRNTIGEGLTEDMTMVVSATGFVCFRNDNITSPADFKTAMNGVYLYYELSTPTETSFTTASLVTENAEIPLSNEDGVLIGKCTEQLSNESGFFDAKIKLADDDGECYSNKIQLHVERSPQ